MLYNKQTNVGELFRIKFLKKILILFFSNFKL